MCRNSLSRLWFAFLAVVVVVLVNHPPISLLSFILHTPFPFLFFFPFLLRPSFPSSPFPAPNLPPQHSPQPLPYCPVPITFLNTTHHPPLGTPFHLFIVIYLIIIKLLSSLATLTITHGRALIPQLIN
ncbi:hypothetical protein F5H01DRAFT_84953 [Linnemannia elongata]|nr:hypothetical protein F5H01DRAFT_84953 [Linnemannia elongata]